MPPKSRTQFAGYKGPMVPMSAAEVRGFIKHAKRRGIDLRGDGVFYSAIQPVDLGRLCYTLLWLNSGTTSPRVRALASLVLRHKDPMSWLKKMEAKRMAASLVNQSPNKLPDDKRPSRKRTLGKR